MKVAIIGTAGESKIEIPSDFLRWGFNHRPFTEVDIWFDIHRSILDLNPESRYFNFLKNMEENVYLAFPRKDLPQVRHFPYKDLIQEFGNYFTNSVSWLIAYAITLNVKEILLSGINMQIETEYEYQKPNCEYFIGIAKGKGIKVIIPEKSSLCKAKYLYGIEG